MLFSYTDNVPEASGELHQWVRSGEICILENITGGLDKAAWAYGEMMRGNTSDKNMVAATDAVGGDFKI